MTGTSAARRPARRLLGRPGAAGLAVVVLALAGACASQPDDAAAPGASTRPTGTATTAPAEPDAPATPTTGTGTPGVGEPADDDAPAWGTTDDVTASADALLTVTGVRLGTHDGYDRVVVDLGGTGTPGVHVERSDAAVEDPTGDAVDLGGAGVLTLYVTGLGYPADTGVTELPVGTRTPGGTVVTGAQFTGTFEGQTQVFLGLTDPEAPARVFVLSDPARVVVDVQRSTQ
jgi:hypothetical protein